jgi:hypothetical protein
MFMQRCHSPPQPQQREANSIMDELLNSTDQLPVTKFNVSLHKHVQSANSTLQCLFISTTIFKDLDVKLGHIMTMNSSYTHVTLSLMDGTYKATWERTFPPCLSLHIHSKYLTTP